MCRGASLACSPHTVLPSTLSCAQKTAWGWEGLAKDEGEAGGRSALSSSSAGMEKQHPRKWSQASIQALQEADLEASKP